MKTKSSAEMKAPAEYQFNRRFLGFLSPEVPIGRVMVLDAANDSDDVNYDDFLFLSAPPKPAKPTGVKATPGNETVSLTWNANTEADLLGYNVYRDGARVNAANVTVTSYEDAGLVNGTPHCYTIRAVSGAGEGPDSDQVCATPVGPAVPTFRRGDADGSGEADLTDAVVVLAHLFLGGGTPTCRDAADTDDNGSLELTDGIFLLSFLFQGGGTPPAPGPFSCGPDTTPSPDNAEPCVYPACP